VDDDTGLGQSCFQEGQLLDEVHIGSIHLRQAAETQVELTTEAPAQGFVFTGP